MSCLVPIGTSGITNFTSGEYSVMSYCLQNGKELQASGWSFNKSLDDGLVSWEIDLIVPVPISPTDRFSIIRWYGLPKAKEDDYDPLLDAVFAGDNSAASVSYVYSGSTGAGGYVVQDAPADGWDFFLDSDQFVNKIRGKSSGGGGITSSALSKDVYFINSGWLSQQAPYGYQTKDGALYYKMTDWSPNWVRMYVDGLPGKDVPDGSYDLVIGNGLHFEVSKYLADKVGCDYYSNCPGITVKKVFKAAASSTVLQILWELNKLWNPTITVKVKPGGAPIINCVYHGTTLQESGLRRISLSEESCTFAGREIPSSDKEKVIDHVIIKGIKGKVTASQVVYPTQNNAVTDIPEVEYDEDFSVSGTESYDRFFQKKVMGDFKEQFGKPSDKKPRMPRRELTRTVHTEYYHVDSRDHSNYLLIRSVQDNYAYDRSLNSEILVHRVQVKHKFGPAMESIGSQELEWMSVRLPGLKNFQWVLVKGKTVDQSKIYTELKKAEVSEMIEEKLVATKVTTGSGNNRSSYYTNPVRLTVAHENDYVSTNPQTRQVLLDITSKIKNTRINRANAELLLQCITDYDAITGLSKYNSQIIKNPNKPRLGATDSEKQFTAEFYNGAGPYSPAFTFEHPDIEDEGVAYMVAQLIFNRSAVKKKVITVQVSAPLVVDNLPVIIKTPSFSVRAYLKADGLQHSDSYFQRILEDTDPIFTELSSLAISSETYCAIGVSESFSSSNSKDNSGNHNLKLRLRSVL